MSDLLFHVINLRGNVLISGKCISLTLIKRRKCNFTQMQFN